MHGTSTLIEGLSGGNNTNSTGGLGDIARSILVGTTRVGGDVLENQPVIEETGKTITAGAISAGSQIISEVSKHPELLQGANDISNALQNAFQGLLG